VPSQATKPERVFKTGWFAKAARKARIPDEELCSAIQQVVLGQANDLGGGVFKKRLRKNQYRSIILSRAGHYWSMSIYSPSRARPISGMMSSLASESWLRYMQD
jgi:hypothetical protein